MFQRREVKGNEKLKKRLDKYKKLQNTKAT
jgi:hypothetical protein